MDPLNQAHPPMVHLSYLSRKRMVNYACALTIEPLTRSPRRTSSPSPLLTTSWINSKEPLSSPRLICAQVTIKSGSTQMMWRRLPSGLDMDITNKKSCHLDLPMLQPPSKPLFKTSSSHSLTSV